MLEIADRFCYVLFLLMAGHALFDFVLQTSFTSQAKYETYNKASSYGVSWFTALMCHSLVHGGAVALVTGSWLLGVAETVCHALTDYAKSRGRINTFTDQAVHIGCKVVWTILAITWSWSYG